MGTCRTVDERPLTPVIFCPASASHLQRPVDFYMGLCKFPAGTHRSVSVHPHLPVLDGRSRCRMDTSLLASSRVLADRPGRPAFRPRPPNEAEETNGQSEI